MMVSELMQQKNMTKYRLAKNSGIPYTTVNDICSGRARLDKCSAETVFKLSRELNISMEALLEPYITRSGNFELFKSNACHKLKQLGDMDFIIDTLERDDISKYHRMKWYPESLYLLAMLDYISRVNQVPLCTKYDDLRRSRLIETIYPASVLAAAAVAKDERIKEQSVQEAIPEFVRFNIVESEVRDVI
jgi:transcriptional regulator with XRE-family HTH domain